MPTLQSGPENSTVPLVHHVAQRRNVVLLVALMALVVTAVGALVFGPARGARNDIGHVRTDLHGTHQTLQATLRTTRASLARTTALLHSTETALTVSRQGLTVARQSEQLAGTTAANTTTLVQQTGSTLTTVQQVVTALGPLQRLTGDVATVTRSVQAGLTVALDAGPGPADAEHRSGRLVRGPAHAVHPAVVADRADPTAVRRAADPAPGD